ncbi:MAG: hypothetical protein M1840_008886 [Geoglossum simile]|nr:MAG: hypothetical protein M1840_008886 [Geoglossum simile]
MANSGLKAQSLKPGLQFNWVFLIELLVCSVLTLFFLFYFNRLFATLVSYGIRAYTWHKYRVWIDIQALQISLLGGRVFFKGFRYHGDNETILVHGGYITWRYWLRKVKIAECRSEKTQEHRLGGTAQVRGRNFDGGERGGPKGPTELPCRIVVSLQGLEWFVYNRSAAYDYIRANILGVDGEDQEGGAEAAEPGEVGATVDASPHPGETPTGKNEAYSLTHEKSESTNHPRPANSSTSEKPAESHEGDGIPTSGAVRTNTTIPISPVTTFSSEDVDNSTHSESTQMDSILLNALPIRIDCNKGAIVMGNGGTKCILVTKFEKATGQIDAGHARHVDKYKQLFKFHFTRPVIQLKPNPDYAEPQVYTANRAKETTPIIGGKRLRWLYQIDRRKIWRKIKRLMLPSRIPGESTTAGTVMDNPAHSTQPFVYGEPDRWLGLSRYLDDSQQGEQDEWGPIEYATFPTVLDCPSAKMSFYWDVPGLVSRSSVVRSTLPPGVTEDINGDIPPEWGIDLSLQGGTIHYGPWTDRQRAHLQSIFFPKLYKNSTPARKLKPGESRVSSIFKLFVELDEQIVLRVPVREGSKDWKWKGKSRAVSGTDLIKRLKVKKPKGKANDKSTPGPGVRPFGWLDLKVMANSTASYSMDMVAYNSGYKNKLDLDLRGSELSTSVNHGTLWKCDHQTISCDLSNPLEWSGLHTWKFEVFIGELELFLLREHILLLTDLINDWGSGPPSDYYTFTPFRYVANLRFSNFRMYLNVNDSNIVNNPSDPDDNTFIILHGPDLSGEITIPLDKYRPTQNDISFKVATHKLCVSLHTPPWNTQATFLDSTKMADIEDGALNGRYNYHSSTLTSNTDTLTISIQGSVVSVDLYGFLIRCFIKLKENYFGENTHFKTLEEFQDLVTKRQSNAPPPDARVEHHKKINELDVILNIQVEEASALLPANLYSSKGNIRFNMASLNVDLRFTNYYMDLKVTLSPLAVSLSGCGNDEATPGLDASPTQLFIDGINIYGHRLFGLPPTEPTYVCNWDFAVGSITGEISVDFLKSLSLALRAFAFTFDDDENALPLVLLDVLHDVTFLKANVQQIRVWLHVDEVAFLLEIRAIKARFNDWATISRSDLLSLDILDLTLACVDGVSASRHRSQPLTAVRTHGFLQTTILFTMIQRKAGFNKIRTQQQKHIKYHDQRTGRAEFLVNDISLADTASGITGQTQVDPPTMPFPSMPEPLLGGDPLARDNSSYRSGSLTRSTDRSVSRKSSFLSQHASSIGSSASVVKRSSSYHSVPESTPNLWPNRELSMTRIANPFQAKFSSAPTGEQIPLRRVNPQDLAHHNGLPPPSVTFSSAFVAPYFPLLKVQPDQRDVPTFTVPNHDQDRPNRDNHRYGDFITTEADEDAEAEHTGFLVDFRSGIRSYCNPEALRSIINLLAHLQPKTPVDIIDDLQLDVASKIVNHTNDKARIGKTIDYNVKIPYTHIRFSNSNPAGIGHISQREDGHCDLTMTQFVINARSRLSRQAKDTIEGGNQLYSMHLLLDSLSLSAGDHPENDGAAIHMQIKELVFWIVSEEVATANLNIRAVDAAMDSKSLVYIETLIRHTGLLASELAKASSGLGQTQKKRLQCLIFNLARAGEGVPDPLFLTRPSYVLRSAPDHLRLDDSWKIVSRFRHMYRSLPNSVQNGLSLQCLSDSNHCPKDAQRIVISSLDQWRSWELAHVKESYAMRRIYDSLEDTLKPPVRAAKASLILRSLKFVIDPGPKENEASLDGVIVGIQSGTPQIAPTGDPDPQPSHARTTTLQIHSHKVGVRLNWELCELVEDILNLYDSPKRRTTLQPPKPSSLEGKPIGDHQYHLVIGTENGLITLDGINLRVISSAQELTLSLTCTESSSGNKAVTALLHANAASSEVVSHSRQVLLAELQSPSLYLALDAETPEQAPVHVWKLAANCEKLRFQLFEEIIDLIGVIDLILGDEVTQILRLAKGRQTTKRQPTPSTARDRRPRYRISIGLLLDAFEINFALLHSLEYVCSGAVARTSITTRQDSELVFNFDLKEHRHEICTTNDGISESISVLNMPFVNSRIRRTKNQEKLFQVFVSIDSVTLDGSAVHGLLNAFRRPEVANTIDDARAEIQAVTKHFERTFGTLDKPDAPEASPSLAPLVYDAHIAVAGLDIRENTPEADLGMSFGCFQMNAANRPLQSGPILEFPEIQIGLRHVVFELLRSNGDCRQSCGNLAFGAQISLSSKRNLGGRIVPAIHVKSNSLEINLFAETASTIVSVITHLQSRIKKLDFSEEVKVLRTRLRRSRPLIAISDADLGESISIKSENAFSLTYSLEMLDIQICWIVGNSVSSAYDREIEDLVLSFKRIELAMKKENATRLMIEGFQLQMVPSSQSGKKTDRSLNSALLPEVVFNVAHFSTKGDRRLAFQAKGKALDLHLTSEFILPASHLERSIATASKKFRAASAAWDESVPTQTGVGRSNLLGNKRLASLLVDADFAGAVVYIQGKRIGDPRRSAFGAPYGAKSPQHGRYEPFIQGDTSSSSTTLRAPGVACKIEYADDGKDDPSLNAEIKVDASSNTLYPTVVPLVMEISSSVKDIVREDEDQSKSIAAKHPAQKFLDEDKLITADPSAILGRCKLNVGLRICNQEFSLSCQPVARVAATARIEDLYITVNTVKSADHGHFFAISAAFTRFEASVQHVYSRESTGSFDIESIVLSLMNSKHVSGTSGISAILKISPMRGQINAKQLQDFLLFREIWVPAEIRRTTTTPIATPISPETPAFTVQRYQQVAAAGAFPWNATIAIAELDVQLDLGQSLGKSAFVISNFWVCSKKTSDWEQSLCLGFGKTAISSTGRMSGFVELQDFKIRTSIQWPLREKALNQTPLVQASISFEKLRAKTAFEFQPFLIADITSFGFMMYNVRDGPTASGDRLVASLDGDKVQVFFTTSSAAQGYALYQALLRLVQEKRTAYDVSLKEIEKFLTRRSMSSPSTTRSQELARPKQEDTAPFGLHTDVVVTLKALNVGAFPSTFLDNQLFKVEASDAEARFAVTMDGSKIHSGLGMTLGQLRISLSPAKRIDAPQIPGEVSVDDVVTSATDSRGGTILQVPKVVATMQTWQVPGSNKIDYIFRSSFEGKVDVGWNYNRIQYIRTMWTNHSRLLSQRLGKPLLSQTTLTITGGPRPVPEEDKGSTPHEATQEKITAVVNVPQSRYNYTALEDPVIDAPQLRDMGEATPPLEWIGLHRERLPGLTHQIVIVALLEIARESELFDRVLWVLKRRTAEGYNLEDLFYYEYFSEQGHDDGRRLAKELWRTLKNTSSGKTLFVLDGLDEVSEDLRHDDDMFCFLGEFLNQLNVIITSRPYANLPAGLSAFDLELETIGFYPDRVNDYLEKAFSDPGRVDKVQSRSLADSGSCADPNSARRALLHLK